MKARRVKKKEEHHEEWEEKQREKKFTKQEHHEWWEEKKRKKDDMRREHSDHKAEKEDKKREAEDRKREQADAQLEHMVQEEAKHAVVQANPAQSSTTSNLRVRRSFEQVADPGNVRTKKQIRHFEASDSHRDYSVAVAPREGALSQSSSWWGL
jgi:hypothetical protein